MENICGTTLGVGVIKSGWFLDGLRWSVGNGKNSSFSNNPWLKGDLLRYKFNHYFFYLHVDNNIIVVEMRKLSWGLRERWHLPWERRKFSHHGKVVL